VTSTQCSALPWPAASPTGGTRSTDTPSDASRRDAGCHALRATGSSVRRTRSSAGTTMRVAGTLAPGARENVRSDTARGPIWLTQQHRARECPAPHAPAALGTRRLCAAPGVLLRARGRVLDDHVRRDARPVPPRERLPAPRPPTGHSRETHPRQRAVPWQQRGRRSRSARRRAFSAKAYRPPISDVRRFFRLLCHKTNAARVAPSRTLRNARGACGARRLSARWHQLRQRRRHVRAGPLREALLLW